MSELLSKNSYSKNELSQLLGQKQISGQLKKVLKELLDGEYIEYTIPEKPQSRLQKYRLREKGKAWIEKNRL
ncbi:MAG: ATP-dependent DNA helicase [Proteobacteria bacterium]|nr:ATP-dependent DNA helicase [Pseudomonadota bacterium]